MAGPVFDPSQRIAILERELEDMAELSTLQFQYIAELEEGRATDLIGMTPKRDNRRSRLLAAWDRIKSMRGRRPERLHRHADAKSATPSVASDLSPLDHRTLIEGSGLFDDAFYAGHSEAEAAGISPVVHYLAQGEASGLAPSALFDPNFYRTLHSDIAWAGVSPLVHYILHGRAEGRRGQPSVAALAFPTHRLRSDRDTIVIAIHEASRTGAPILGWNLLSAFKDRYNVVALLKGGGPLVDAMASVAHATIVLPDGIDWSGAEGAALAAKSVKIYAPKFMIANSVETRAFVPPFERAGIPVVALVHEFVSTVRPNHDLWQLFGAATEIVFPAQIVADAALAEYRGLAARRYRVLSQGPCASPVGAASADEDDLGSEKWRELPPKDGTIVVLGLGTVTPRKGVEFFIAAAAAVARKSPGPKVVFVWAGQCYDFDEPYRRFLNEQLVRSGVDGSVLFLGEVRNPSSLYERADIFLLPSRLDPMPNVAIDAAVRGIPVVCFDRASGMSEVMTASDDAKHFVVPYLDAATAADRICALASNAASRRAAGAAMRAIAAKHFRMQHYVDTIDAWGSTAARAVWEVKRSRATIEAAKAFSADFYLGARASETEASDALDSYLSLSRRAAPRNGSNAAFGLRRPREGFHPFIYAKESPDFVEASHEDPLAHYVRNGFPNGRWSHQVIRPDPNRPVASHHLRIAVHGHFHYPELLPDFIARLASNDCQFDLFLTVTSAAAADRIAEIVAAKKLTRTKIIAVPNRGRDIGPMLTGPLKSKLRGYDIFAHIHGKRSLHAPSGVGDRWRNFLWENLIGGQHAMMDRVLAEFVADDALGLVFPEDPHLSDWDGNRGIAEQLARRMRLAGDLPMHFDFPLGTMFWARPAALRGLFDLNLGWDDYPDEPAPIDGTILHALERLIPFVAADAGFRYATTSVKGVMR